MNRNNEEEGPVYYREIQKHAYLKRLPTDHGNKLLPLVHKKPPLRPMWTLLCVHNGRTPYLEQYPEAESAETLAHKPVWRACLDSARHVTASVAPHVGREHDFLIDTDRGAVRMLAPDWATMQDWVTTLRTKLAELKIVSRGENVYCAPPAPPPPRAGTRDPTSPLPPPPAPPARVPGIELPETLTTPTPTPTPIPITNPNPEPEPIENTEQEAPEHEQSEHENTNQIEEIVDISQWDSNLDLSQPSTSTDKKESKAVKICGQNIALDDSILKRDIDSSIDFDIDSTDSESIVLNFDENSDGYKKMDFKQRVMIGGGTPESGSSKFQGTNITVIQVSNKPPHTAIPVLGNESDVFDFDFKQKLNIDDNKKDFVNIVNTENGYGTVFDSKESEYGHLSLTTTVNLTGVTENGVYERLCMASTSGEAVKKVKSMEKCRKSSLPNMECRNTSPYEYIFPGNTVSTTVLNSNTENTNISVINTRTESPRTETGSRECDVRPEQVTVRPEQINVRSEQVNARSEQVNVRSEQVNVRPEQVNVRPELTRPQRPRREPLTSTVSVGSSNLDSNTRAIGANVERSPSQSSYDNVRTNRKLYSSPKRGGKLEKTENVQPKPIWKRGLTELSLLTRLKGITQRDKRPENQDGDRNGSSPSKVVHRSRPDVRVDNGRRRSSSWSDETRASRPRITPPMSRTEIAISCLHAPVFADYRGEVWIAYWGLSASRAHGRAGDRVSYIRATRPKDANHARQLARARPPHPINILFHRVPLGKFYVLNKNSENEVLGIKLDSECNITSVAANSVASRACLPPRGAWAVTEVNGRQINLIKGGEEDINRLSQGVREVTLLIQPSPLVKKLRTALKADKSLRS